MCVIALKSVVFKVTPALVVSEFVPTFPGKAKTDWSLVPDRKANPASSKFHLSEVVEALTPGVLKFALTFALLIPSVPVPTRVAVLLEIVDIVPTKSILALAPETETEGAGSTDTLCAVINSTILPL